MRAFFMAILMAMANLAKGGLNAMGCCWRTFCGLFLGGGGGGGATPGPLDLPSKDLYEIDRSIEEGHQRAADTLSNASAAMQIKLFAAAKPDERFSIDLSQLEPSHQEWLSGLSTNDKAMRSLSDAPQSKIAMLLSGHDGIIPGLDAPKNEKARETIPGLVTRMDDFRLRLAARESDHVLAA